MVEIEVEVVEVEVLQDLHEPKYEVARVEGPDRAGDRWSVGTCRDAADLEVRRRRQSPAHPVIEGAVGGATAPASPCPCERLTR